MPKRKRKVIQIAMATHGNSDDFGSYVVALCDDGSIWREGYNGQWDIVSTRSVEFDPPTVLGAAT